MLEIVKSVREAEFEAVIIREAAEAKAAEILSKAEEQAAKIARDGEAYIKSMREEKLRAAEKKARDDYDKAVESEYARRKKDADELIARADNEVVGIVGRITVGNR